MKDAAKKRRTGRRQKAPSPTMELMCLVSWTDPLRAPDAFYVNARYDPESELASMSLDINLRQVASLEIRPARRPLTDKAGVVVDAIRLANAPI